MVAVAVERALIATMAVIMEKRATEAGQPPAGGKLVRRRRFNGCKVGPEADGWRPTDTASRTGSW
jgi:hypothetical protein